MAETEKPNFEATVAALIENCRKGDLLPCRLCGGEWRPDPEADTSERNWRVCDACWIAREQERAGVGPMYLKASMKDFSQEMRGKLLQLLMDWGYLWGDRGVGKSHAASALVNQKIEDCLKRRAYPGILFLRWGDLKRELTSTFKRTSEVSEKDLMERLVRVPILILDDVSDQIGDESYSLKVFAADLIDRRYTGKKTTIATSNLSLGDLGAKIDSKVSDRIYQMCGQGVRVIEFKLGNRRTSKGK